MKTLHIPQRIENESDNEVTFLSLSVILMRVLHYYLREENAKYVGPACTFASVTRKNVLNKSYSNSL